MRLWIFGIIIFQQTVLVAQEVEVSFQLEDKCICSQFPGAWLVTIKNISDTTVLYYPKVGGGLREKFDLYALTARNDTIRNPLPNYFMGGGRKIAISIEPGKQIDRRFVIDEFIPIASGGKFLLELRTRILVEQNQKERFFETVSDERVKLKIRKCTKGRLERMFASSVEKIYQIDTLTTGIYDENDKWLYIESLKLSNAETAEVYPYLERIAEYPNERVIENSKRGMFRIDSTRAEATMARLKIKYSDQCAKWRNPSKNFPLTYENQRCRALGLIE